MIEDFRIPLGSWIEDGVDALTETLSGFFDVLTILIDAVHGVTTFLFSAPPAPVMIAVLVGIGLLLRGWRFALGSLAGFVLVLGLDQWAAAMDTFSLVLVAAVFAVAIAVPVGIGCARSDTASATVRPVLDFLQTMPPFVYLIPALMLFGLGDVPGVVATVLFAVAPGVRLTELGIRNVDPEIVEAGHAFGSTPGRILRQVQLPLAMPSIMAGVNQVIMLSLSMVVIASMVGAVGLGRPVLQSLSQVDLALGVEAGLSVVIIAIYLDRITASFNQGRGYLGTLLGMFRARRAAAEVVTAEERPTATV